MTADFPLPPAVVHNKRDEPCRYISNPLLCESINLVHHQTHFDSLQQIPIYEQVTQKSLTTLTEEFCDTLIIPDKYKAHSDEFLRLLSEFEDM